MAASEDDIRRNEDNFDKATAVIRKALPGKPGFSAEAKYGQAYQSLVNMGLRPQIKRKYRG